MALSALETDRLLNAAVAAMQRGDFPAAHEAASQGIEGGAEHPLLLKIEALWLNANGQHRDALRLFHHARTLTPNDPSVLNGIAGCLAGMGAYNAALKIIDESLSLASTAAPTHHLRGWILELREDYAVAGQAYERALQLAPNFPEAAAGVALMAAKTGDFPVAHSYAARALAMAPGHPVARIAQALAIAALGNPSLAEGDLRRLTESTDLPNRLRALAFAALSEVFEKLNQPVEAASARTKKNELMAHEPKPIEDALEDLASAN